MKINGFHFKDDVGLWSLYGGLFISFNVCPFDCTAIAGSGKVGPLNLRLTTPAR